MSKFVAVVKPWIVPVSTLAAGGLGGWLFTKKRYQKIANQEIDSVREFFHREIDRLSPEEVFISPEAAVKALHPDDVDEEYDQRTRVYTGTEMPDHMEQVTERGKLAVRESLDKVVNAAEDIGESAEVIVGGIENVFENHGDDLAFVPSVDGTPYLITEEEYQANEEEYTQLTFTYWEGDDVLADDAEKAVDDIEGIAGRDALVRFGARSNDKNIVYVRNTRLEIDIEIIRDLRSFKEIIHGIRPDVQRPHKMRDDE